MDRILAVVGDRVISWSAALTEAHYQAFRSGQEPPRWGPPGAALSDDVRQVVARMIDQTLLEEAQDRSPFRAPESESSPDPLQEMQRRFADSEAYRQALARYQLTEAELSQRLARESHLLAFIVFTLRPQVRITPEQIVSYYQNALVPELLRQQGEAKVPPLSEVREQMEEVLAQQEINRLLEAWLEELRRSRAAGKVTVWPE